VVDPGVDVLLVWVPVFGGGVGVVLTAAVGFFLASVTAGGAAFGGFF
jgi:hypothetical protein